MPNIWLIICITSTAVIHFNGVDSLTFPAVIRNHSRRLRSCEQTLSSTTMYSSNDLQKKHVCSRHLTTENASFRCYKYNNTTLNFRAILRGLQRKSLKLKLISLLTFQQYFSARTSYIEDWSLYTLKPCLKIISHCAECGSLNFIYDLQRDFNILKTIHEIVGSVIQEEKPFLLSSDLIFTLKFLHKSVKQLLCELHSFLLMYGSHDVMHGFVGDVISSSDWCVFETISTRYERDVYLLRQVSVVASEIHNRYSMLIP